MPTSLHTSPKLPELWTSFLDEVLVSWTKSKFSPKPQWGLKPFDVKDVAFFSKGLIELSQFFTEDRPESKLPKYFSAPKFRSAYFFYYLPIHGAKFLALLDTHRVEFQRLINDAKKRGQLTIWDVGSGPGTASFAIMAAIFEEFKKTKKIPFKIEFHWLDRDASILNEGRDLFGAWLARLPEFSGEISIVTHSRDWLDRAPIPLPEADLLVFGNMINESGASLERLIQNARRFSDACPHADVLWVEPAFKSASQRLGHVRDALLRLTSANPDENDQNKAKSDGFRIVGPCLHHEECPLKSARDWCHFSMPVQLPGKWFRLFSIRLGSIREWLKFSYLWIAKNESHKKITEKDHWVRVLSDSTVRHGNPHILVCKPDHAPWIQITKKRVFRGELWRETPNHQPQRQTQHDQHLQPLHPKTRNRKSVRRPSR